MRMAKQRRKPIKIAILGYEGAQLLDIAGPADAFDVASRELRAADPMAPTYEVILAAGTRSFRTTCGIKLSADAGIDQLVAPGLDTLLVAGGRSAREVAKREAIQVQIRRASKRARRVAAVCTGAWILAAAGLLDGRRATTHWAACAELAAAHPAVAVHSDAIFVRDEPVWTSAGVTSGIDLALAMIEEDHGRDLALHVARHLVAFLKRPGGQSQFSAPLAAQMAERSPVREAQCFAIENPAENLTVEALASRAAMSPRNFARVFQRETGTTPGDFIERVRIDTARRLLEDADLTAQQVAHRSGFGEADTMRRAFLRRIGATPREYRARFRS